MKYFVIMSLYVSVILIYVTVCNKREERMAIGVVEAIYRFKYLIFY